MPYYNWCNTRNIKAKTLEQTKSAFTKKKTLAIGITN